MEGMKRTKLNIAICDDEPSIAAKLRSTCEHILAGAYDLHIETAYSAKELLQRGGPFQIALLDVQLPGRDGIDLAREMMMRNQNCCIIFVSGFLNVVSDVYEVPHFCFILKEQMDEKLPNFLNRAALLAAEDARKKITISCGKQNEDILLCDLVMLERRGRNTFCTLLDGTALQCKEKLPDLLARIGSAYFVRCHISYAVNLAYVRKEEDNGFRLTTGQWVPISRPNQQSTREAFWRYMRERV